MQTFHFENRTDAGRQLAEQLRHADLDRPLVLAIPRGGVGVGAALARELGAELDVVLVCKLRAADRPEVVLGAISESGDVHLNSNLRAMTDATREHLEIEQRRQMWVLDERRCLFRLVRTQAPVQGRSVILTDDGIVTGSTMMAALRAVRAAGPREIIVAVPAAAPDRLADISQHCERVVCLQSPEGFWAIGPFYRSIGPVSDDQVVETLRRFAPPGSAEAEAWMEGAVASRR